MHIAGGHGGRTAPVALAHCRATRLHRFVLNTKFVVRGTLQAHDAASPARRSKYRTPQGGDGAHVGRAAVAKFRVFGPRGLDAVGERLDAGRRVVGLVVGKTTERLRLSWVVSFILGTGEGEDDARRLGLGLGLVHCRDPVVNWSYSAPLVVTWIS